MGQEFTKQDQLHAWEIGHKEIFMKVADKMVQRNSHW